MNAPAIHDLEHRFVVDGCGFNVHFVTSDAFYGVAMKVSATIAMCVCLGGCVSVPVYKKLQPNATMIVNDVNGHPVSGVEVTLIANAYPYGREKGRETHESDASGIAKFASRREWRTEAPWMMHGSEVYFWNWCVRKDGYTTYRTVNSNARSFEPAAKIVLDRGETSECLRERR